MPGDDQGAQTVDAVLQNDRPRRDDAAHQAHREALGDHFAVEALFDGKVFPAGDQVLDPPGDVEDAEDHRHRLRQDGGHRRTLDPHAAGHKGVVQPDVQAGGEDQENQRHHAVAHRPQQGRAEVVGEHDHHILRDGPDVAVGFLDDLGRGVQRFQQRVEEEQPRRRDDGRRRQPDDDGAGHRLFDLGGILGAVGAGGDDGQAVADADAEADQQLIDRAAGAHRRQRGVAQNVAHDHGVGRVVHLLEQVGNKNGYGKKDQVFEDGAVDQVHLPPRGPYGLHCASIAYLCGFPRTKHGPRESGSRVCVPMFYSSCVSKPAPVSTATLPKPAALTWAAACS